MFELVNGVYVKKDLKDVAWNEDSLQQFREQAVQELENVLKNVKDETADLCTLAEFYGAKDPIKLSTGVYDCSGDTYKVCNSRVLKWENNQFFEIYYDIPYIDEIDEIKEVFYKFFLSYYVQNPTVRKKIICSDSATLQTKLTVKEIDLALINNEQYNELYGDHYWLKAYFDIKLAENNIKLKPTVYKKHLKKIIDLSRLNHGKQSQLSGLTSKNLGHAHDYSIDLEGNGETALAVHPDNSNVKHKHKINRIVSP